MKYIAAIAVALIALIILLNALTAGLNPGVQDAQARAAAAQAYETAARAQAQATAQAAWAGEQPARQGALTLAAWSVLAAVALAVLGTATAWARYAHLRATFAVATHDAARVAVLAQAGQMTVIPPMTRQRAIAAGPAGAEPAGLLDAPAITGGELPAAADVFSWAPGGRLALPVGVGTAGPVAIPLAGELALVLVGGLPGMGKSTLLRAMIAGLARQSPNGERAQIAVIDPKRVDYNSLPADLALLRYPVARDIDAAGRLLRALHAELDDRFTTMERAGARSYLDAGLPVLVAFVDELAILAGDDAMMRDLLYLGRLGRSGGVCVVAATQRPSARVIGGDLKALADVSIALSCRSATDSRIILDVAGAELLPRQPGRALYRRGELVPVQAYGAGSFDRYMQGLPRGNVARLADPGPQRLKTSDAGYTGQKGASAAPVTPVTARFAWNEDPDDATAAEMRDRYYEDGWSLNQICRHYYGSKSGPVFLAVKRAILPGGKDAHGDD